MTRRAFRGALALLLASAAAQAAAPAPVPVMVGGNEDVDACSSKWLTIIAG
jgi:hypothetical protein